MRRSIPYVALWLALLVMPSWADMTSHVAINVSSLAGHPFELELNLYDNSGVIGDSWALIDNVVLGGTQIGFEDGTLNGFDASLNPASVKVAPGALDGTGNCVLRIDEDPVFTPTITFCDFSASTAVLLEFDMAFTGSTKAGFFGLDQFVVRLLDPQSLDPLLPGMTPGVGDLLAVDARGAASAAGVTLTPIQSVPVPGAAILAAIGLACTGIARRRRAGE